MISCLVGYSRNTAGVNCLSAVENCLFSRLKWLLRCWSVEFQQAILTRRRPPLVPVTILELVTLPFLLPLKSHDHSLKNAFIHYMFAIRIVHLLQKSLADPRIYATSFFGVSDSSVYSSASSRTVSTDYGVYFTSGPSHRNLLGAGLRPVRVRRSPAIAFKD